MNTSVANDTQFEITTNGDELTEDLQEKFRVPWLIGIIFGSTVALVIQLLILILIPNVRKVRLLILTHMTTARWLHVVLEYIVNYTWTAHPILVDALFSLYFQADVVLICWMSVFSGNLFYKVVIVLPYRKFYFKITSVLIWTLTIPCGIMFVMCLSTDTAYNAYAIVKFVVLSVNLCLTTWTLVVAVKLRHNKQSNELKNVVKICLMALILISVTSAQILITDIQSFLSMGVNEPMFILSLINSFQAIAMTIFFCTLANQACDKSLLRKINTKLRQVFGIFHLVSCAKKNVHALHKEQSTPNV